MTLEKKTQLQQDNQADRRQTWWHHCAPDERAYWCRQAGSAEPSEAWQAYQQTLASPCGKMLITDTACPDCGYPAIDALEFPDGRATYCPDCGYRDLEHNEQRANTRP